MKSLDSWLDLIGVSKGLKNFVTGVFRRSVAFVGHERKELLVSVLELLEHRVRVFYEFEKKGFLVVRVRLFNLSK